MSKTRKRASQKAASRPRARGAVAAPPRGRPLEVPRASSGIEETLDTLRDTAQPATVRLEALQAVQAASFAAPDFEAVRPEYIAILREVARDPDPELRQRTLGILAREHDGFAQKVLVEGLRRPDKALVPPDKALQLLSYDPHAGAVPLAREMLKASGDDSVRREAVRLLAGDPQSAPLLEELLTDRREAPEVRRMSATALHALNPDRLQRWAARAAADERESDEIVATSLTALAHFGDPAALEANTKLQARLERLQQDGPPKIRQLARQLARRHER
jgi:hypothetical protein